MQSLERAWWNLVRFGFRLLYNELAFTYDTVSKVVSLGAWRCWQRTAIKHLPAPTGAPILELAHGTGDLQIDLHAAGYRTVGYDLSPRMGRIARAKLTRQGVPARLARGYAQALPFGDGAFPAVVCTFPTPFIIEQTTVREIYRVLQPGGRLVVVPSGVLTGGTVADDALEWLYDITGQRGGGFDPFTQAFTDAGFRVEVMQEQCPRSVVVVLAAHKANLG